MADDQVLLALNLKWSFNVPNSGKYMIQKLRMRLEKHLGESLLFTTVSVNMGK